MKKTAYLLLFSLLVAFSATAQSTANVKIEELNTKTFKAKVWDFEKSSSFKRQGKLPIILDFHATWCRPCKMLAPHLQAIQNKYNGKLIVYKIDVDLEPELAKKFKVEAMPTIVFVNSATSFKSELGYRDYAEFEALVKSHFFKK
jgi:thioredoxin 1